MHYRTLTSLRSLTLHLGLSELLVTLAILTATSVLAAYAAPYLSEAASALIFVLGIILAGALCGLAAALVTALGAFLIFNFYLAEPILTFRLATGNDIAPLVVFNLCALVAGILSGLLKDSAQAAARSNRHLASLLEISHALQSAVRIDEVADALAQMALRDLNLDLVLFRLVDDWLMAIGKVGEAHPWYEFAETARKSPKGVAQSGGLSGYRLDGSRGITGVVVFGQRSREQHDTAFMTALVNLIALAVERALLSERISETEAAVRTEELKTALLSSVSHDFRTPLTAISASASSLIEFREQLDHETTGELLYKILDESERLNRYTANLLEMTRIEGGHAVGRLQMLGVTDMLSAAVQRIRPRASNRQILLRSENVELTVNADAALFELVLINVLENAVLYSADGTRIIIDAERDGPLCCITIADEGQGIPSEEIERVFDRFYRVSRVENAPRGTGLGLAIAKGFVEALGGSIAAKTPGIDGRGTRIMITLPLVSGEGVQA